MSLSIADSTLRCSKNLGRTNKGTITPTLSAMVASWAIHVLLLTHLEHCLLRPPFDQHYQLGLCPDLGFHLLVPPCF